MLRTGPKALQILHGFLRLKYNYISHFPFLLSNLPIPLPTPLQFHGLFLHQLLLHMCMCMQIHSHREPVWTVYITLMYGKPHPRPPTLI